MLRSVRRRSSIIAAVLLVVGATLAQAQQTAVDHETLFNRVIDTAALRFFDMKLAGEHWSEKWRVARPEVIAAPTLDAAVKRINVALGSFGASHFRLYTPDELFYYLLLDFREHNGQPIQGLFGGKRAHFAGVGVFSVDLDGRSFLDAVLEGSPADLAGLKVGDEIVNVDGAPFHLIRSFRGKIGSEVKIAFRRAAEGPINYRSVLVEAITPAYAFEAATAKSVRIITHAGKRYGYFRVWAHFDYKPIVEAVLRLSPGGRLALTYPDWDGRARTRDLTAKDAAATETVLDGLIIDLRGKVGGNDHSETLLNLLGQHPRFQFRGRTGLTADIGRNTRLFNGRVAMLVDHHTRSAAEMLALSFKRAGMGPLIGTTTAGHVLAADTFLMPGDLLLQVPGWRPELNGEIIEGKGVEPDLVVDNPLPYAQGQDSVLSAALERLAIMPAR